MISDWTIYGVYVSYEGMVCVSCWGENYAGEYAEAMADLLAEAVSNTAFEHAYDLAEWLEENPIDAPSVARSLWGQWGLPTWLSEIVDDIKANTDDVFHAPMISVEYDGWEDDCYTCEGTGKRDPTDEEQDETEDHIEWYTCEPCEGYGVTGPRCYECGETI